MISKCEVAWDLRADGSKLLSDHGRRLKLLAFLGGLRIELLIELDSSLIELQFTHKRASLFNYLLINKFKKMFKLGLFKSPICGHCFYFSFISFFP